MIRLSILLQAHSKSTQTHRDLRVKGTQTKPSSQSRSVQTVDVPKTDQACSTRFTHVSETHTSMEVDDESEENSSDSDSDPDWEMEDSYSEDETDITE